MEAQFANRQQKKVLTKDFEAKFRTKGEVYRFLDLDVDAYLPPKECVTIYFLRDLMTGKRKYFDKSDLKIISVPQYDGLSIDDILERGREHHLLEHYLPEDRDMERLPRQYICTIVRGLLKEKFDSWVDGVIEVRNENVKRKGNLEIEMDAKIYKIYQASKNVSTSNGRSAHLLKAGTKRKRTKAMILADHEQQQLEDITVRDSKAKVIDYEKKIAELEEQLSQQNGIHENDQVAANWVHEQIERKNIAVTEDQQLIITSVANTITNADDLMDGSGH